MDEKTTAHGITTAAIWTNHEAHVGAHVVIRSLKIAGEETIAGIHWFGEATESYEISEHAVVHTGKDIWHGAVKVEKTTEKEVKAGIHIIEKGGKRFIKFIDHRDGD